MRVLFVNDVTPESGWGAEIYLTRLAESLEAAGDTVEIFAGEIAHRGVAKVLDVWDPFARRGLRRAAERFLPDVVHHHNVLRELSVSVLGVPQGTAQVLTVHDFRLVGAPDGRLGPLRTLIRPAKDRFDAAVARRQVHAVVAISEELARRLRAAGFRWVEHVGVPVPIPRPDVSDVPVEDASDIVFAGRLTAQKGALVLVEAFARIASRHPRARLVIAGDGPETDAVRAAARPLGDRVSMLGRVDAQTVRELMRRARVVAAPAVPRLQPEGAGLTVIEAAMLGRPVVVSDDLALRELVDATGCGIVVPPESHDAIAQALDRLLSDDHLAATMGRAGTALAARRHSSEAVADAIRGVYRRAVGRASGGDGSPPAMPGTGRR